MKIISLELKGYKYLQLNNIEYIKITPESKLQLILGTNGSGKSSLLQELGPLPGLPAAYQKDGYKIIEIQHLGSHYILKSEFATTGNRFHFIKDDVELNPGRTTTVYRELVRQHFGITPEIHEVCIGATVFHRMSVLERRNWFTRISSADYTYAIQYYQRLKEQLRDAQGIIKINQSRLIQESAKLMTPADEHLTRVKISELQTFISMLLEMKRPVSRTQSEYLSDISKTDAALIAAADQIRMYRSRFASGYNSIADIDDQIIDVQSEMQTMDTRRHHLCGAIDTHQQTLSHLTSSSILHIKDIDQQLSDLDERLQALERSVKLKLVLTEPLEALRSLGSVYEPLTEVFVSIQENPDRKISRQTYTEMLEQRQILTQTITRADHAISELNRRRLDLEHFKAHAEMACPSCNHTWYHGYSEAEYQAVVSQILTVEPELDALTAELSQIDDTLNDAKTYLSQQRVYGDIVKSWPGLEPLWSYIRESEMFFRHPRSLVSVLERFKSDLQIEIQIAHLRTEIAEAEWLKDVKAKGAVTDIEVLGEQLEDMQSQLHRIDTSTAAAKASIIQLKGYKTIISQVSVLEGEIRDHMQRRDAAVRDLDQVQRTHALNESIRVVRLTLSELEQTISKIDIQRALVDDLTAQLSVHQSRAAVLKVAVQALSPTEGLIARNLTGFINHFIRQMNDFISQIWSYPLELVPVSADADSLDLDYRFPVRVNDQSHPAPDVSKGSAAMREIIDLAFRIVSMQYLGLSEFPVYADELGASFDAVHRSKVRSIIDIMVSASNFSNVFIISHYQEMYGSFQTADVIVLSDANVDGHHNSTFNRNTIIS